MSEQGNNVDQTAIDEKLIRLTLKIAQSAVEHGNHPFGALLADKSGKVVLEAENRVTTGKDFTAHAETELIRKAGSEIPSEILKDLTLYTSTEPCVMCSGAICWSGLKRVVYGCPETTLQIYAGKYLSVPCRDTFTRYKIFLLTTT
jgi:tRNA(Arg) A34 adenosine deaminase TadA